MRSRAMGHKGFTLIELMIVVVIIGILAALAIPRFSQATVKTRQSEAKLLLKQVVTNQLLFRAVSPTNSYYSTGAVASAATPNAFAAIDIEIPPNALYSYTIALAGADYVATATADLDGDGFIDTWTTNSGGVLNNTQNDATN